MNTPELFKKINTFIFDIDGVLTDGTILVLENGLQARRMNIKDGFSLQMAVKKGYRVMIVSGGNSPQVANRLENLGVHDVNMAILDKKSFVANYIAKNNLVKEQVLFMGDDLPDLVVMPIVGLPCCPADAVNEIKEAALYVSPLKGGDACVRDVIEKVLKLNGHWNYQEEVASK